MFAATLSRVAPALVSGQRGRPAQAAPSLAGRARGLSGQGRRRGVRQRRVAERIGSEAVKIDPTERSARSLCRAPQALPHLGLCRYVDWHRLLTGRVPGTDGHLPWAQSQGSCQRSFDRGVGCASSRSRSDPHLQRAVVQHLDAVLSGIRVSRHGQAHDHGEHTISGLLAPAIRTGSPCHAPVPTATMPLCVAEHS
jgi:hypothetical protein